MALAVRMAPLRFAPFSNESEPQNGRMGEIREGDGVNHHGLNGAKVGFLICSLPLMSARCKPPGRVRQIKEQEVQILIWQMAGPATYRHLLLTAIYRWVKERQVFLVITRC